jgi:adenosylcobinamide hydrolase
VNGGFRVADCAVNVSVSADFDRRDLDAVVAERCERAGFDADGPALLTAVPQRHARGATAGSVTVVATAGLSNPATLPIVPSKENTDDSRQDSPPVGTVNLLISTDRALDDARLAGFLASAVEAKTATLQATTGFTGTTSDAVAVGSTQAGEDTAFVGSSTEVGTAVRTCVRDALLASLRSTYADGDLPRSVDDAESGVVTECETTVFDP